MADGLSHIESLLSQLSVIIALANSEENDDGAQFRLRNTIRSSGFRSTVDAVSAASLVAVENLPAAERTEDAQTIDEHIRSAIAHLQVAQRLWIAENGVRSSVIENATTPLFSFAP